MEIFNTVLSPFIFLIKQIFLFAYSITNNYGLAIILLSFAVSLLLLPVFVLIEKAKKRDDAVKQKMKPLVDEIKRVYKGQERYYYLRTLNRQHNHSPAKSLLPTLSLLLQIPFFIAAYQYLEHFEGLQGVSFLFIKNLGEPDALLGPVNFLPVLMTIVNLLTAHFYTRNGDGSDRKQMWFVAGLFLVLLFKMPAGLVLYWTMNNVFSFFRLFVTNPEVFKKSPKPKALFWPNSMDVKSVFEVMRPRAFKMFVVLSVVLLGTQFNWAFQNNFEQIGLRIAGAIVGGFIITTIYVFLALTYFSVEAKQNTLVDYYNGYKNLFWVLLLAALAQQLIGLMQNEFINFVWHIIIGLENGLAVFIASVFLIMLLQRRLQIMKSEKLHEVFSLRKVFLIVFVTLFSLLAFTQILWAIQQDSYHSLVARITVVLIISWLVAVIVKNLTLVIHKKSGFFIQNIKLSITPRVYFIMVVLAVYFYFSAAFYYTGVNVTLLYIAAVFIVVLEFIGVISLIWTDKSNINRLAYLLSFGLMFILLGYQLLSMILLLTNGYLEIAMPNIDLSSGLNILGTGLALIFVSMPFYFKRKNANMAHLKKSKWAIFILSALYVFGMIYYWNPIIVFSSFPKNFNFAGITFFRGNFQDFAIGFFGSVLLFAISSKNIKKGLSTIMLSIAITAFLFSSVISFDVGTLQENLLSKEGNLQFDILHYVYEAVFLLAVLFGIGYIVKAQFRKLITVFLILLNIFVAGQSLYLGIQTDKFFDHTNEPESTPNQMGEIPFSKDKPNIVVVVPDGTQGWFMNDIIEENPELKKAYDGFTWYPNTLSTSDYTYSSLPSMLAGDDFTVANMNKDEEHTIIEKFTKATEVFLEKVKDKGYYLSSTNLKFTRMNTDEFDNYIPIWDKQWSKLLNINGQYESWYTRLWENALFNCAPFFLKPGVYNRRNWIVNFTPVNSSELYKYNFVKLLPKISNTNSADSNFIFIHAMFTHAPWDLVTEEGKVIREVSPYANQLWFTKVFVPWIDWMKENDVYDNTKIIMVADHGPSWWHYHKKSEKEVPTQNADYEKLPKVTFLRLNPLMMIKDFNTTGELKTDWRLMSNADVPSIAFDENDPTKADSTSRVLRAYNTVWHQDLHTRIKYKNRSIYEVKDYVYDINNWKKITNE